jgi:hypothetical protein
MVTVPVLTALIALAAARGDPPAAVPPDFQLKPPPRGERILPPPCQRGRGDEIVVCGRGEDERLREAKLPPGVELREGKVIGVDIGGARVEPKLEEVAMPRGAVSKRVMVTVKVPF